jgi:hypothetical protein
MQKATCPEGAEDRAGRTKPEIGISGRKTKQKEEEFRTLLQKHGLSFNERYVWQ